MGLKNRFSKRLSDRREQRSAKGSGRGPSTAADEAARAEKEAAEAARVSRRRSKRPEGGAQAPLGSLGSALWRGLGEVYAIAREMLSIAATVALRVAERIGNFELLILRTALIPAWRRLVTFATVAIRSVEREITPVRATAAVSLFALAIIVVSQFTEYREVRAGVPAYAGVESVAGAPRVDGTVKDAGQAHAYLLLPVALFGLACLAGALRGRWRLARLLALAGAVTILVSLVIDAPKGLDEGVLEIQFEGAEARLLGGFWAQLSAGVVLLVTGPLLAFDLDPTRTRRAKRALTGPTLFQQLGRRAASWRDSRPRLRARGSRSRAQGAST
jgi:hypothetical protein